MAKKKADRNIPPPCEEEVVASKEQRQRSLLKPELVNMAVQLVGWPKALARRATKEELIEAIQAVRHHPIKKANKAVAWNGWTLLQAQKNWKALQVNKSVRAWTALGRKRIGA